MQPQYPGGGYWVPPPPRLHGGENNTFGLLAMIFGILAIPLALCQFPMGFGFPLAAAFGVAGVVLGILGIRRADRGLANNRGMAIAGVVCGTIGPVLQITLFTVFVFVDHLGGD